MKFSSFSREIAYMGPVARTLLLIFFIVTTPITIGAAIMRWVIFYPIWYITSGDALEWILLRYCDFIEWAFQDFKG